MRLGRHESVPKYPDCVDFLGLPEHLDKILSQSDFVILSVPSTPETQGLIGERELRLMKRGAFLINVCRASVVDAKLSGISAIFFFHLLFTYNSR